MPHSTEKECPQCGQRLKFPTNIGGMLMACPSCGNKFYSDFKFDGTQRKGAITPIFEMPHEILGRIRRFFKS